jgi:hypothetical protein
MKTSKLIQRLEVVSGYGPTTVNLHDVYYIMEYGVVTDVWPIRARGVGLGPYCYIRLACSTSHVERCAYRQLRLVTHNPVGPIMCSSPSSDSP